MSVVAWVLYGIAVGIVARLLVPARDSQGLTITLLIGIAGALLGGWLGRMSGLYPAGHPAGLFFALIGSTAGLFVYHTLFSGDSKSF